MLKFVIIIGAAFLLYRMFANDQKKKKDTKVKEQVKSASRGEMVQDPVCGAYVSVDSDIRVREGDKVHRFCSFECRDKYIKRLDQGHSAQTESQTASAQKENA
ncbi:transcriptional regulator [Oceanidesulfovibrio marinus]|uniref:Transcriptional regulator n=1 Tax=Oceanidesulfovibrio marinus TaxID=370038 RepID=A0A6P1ZJ36_9BACT|nr:transcriptional regulator [Oceanidesulfovibrio marinus]QJT08104.1 transcriptional regulator [Oceanidesulfovibrio marinus]TVM35001.1 transcriptional regulator [Oceanidesulfovibrio marinus]